MTSEPETPPQTDDSKPEALSYAEVKARGGEIFRRLGPAGPLALIAASLPAIGGFALLGLLTWLKPWIEAQGDLGILIYILAFTVLAGLAVLPTYAQAVLAGYVFKLTVGSVAALCGIFGASLVGYVIARKASGDRVVQLIEEQPKWRAVYNALLRSSPAKALMIVTLLRIPPNSPFAITNLVLAACRVPVVTYIVATVVGIAPRTIIAVGIGAAADTLDFSKSANIWFFVGGIVVTLIVVGIIGALANQAITRMTADPSAVAESGENEESVTNEN
jgi:uncharacterized membrane protein YdjX (TVP38/TMEM64 family)